MTGSVFHAGEIAAQQRAGFAIGAAPIRPHLTPSQQAFVHTLDLFALAGLEPSGALTATVLAAPLGFVDGGAGDHFTIDLPAHTDTDPLIGGIVPGRTVGGLGIDFAARRRVRINGRVASKADRRLTIAIDQAFGNCSKYITPRLTRSLIDLPPGPATALPRLDDHARAMIAAADTALLATASGPDPLANGGVDLSHRGGPPGFLHLAGNRLSLPDFPGNRYMNSLGNLLRHPQAALLLIDITSGSQLHLRGSVTIDWDPPAGWVNVQRVCHLEIESAWLRPGRACPEPARRVCPG